MHERAPRTHDLVFTSTFHANGASDVFPARWDRDRQSFSTMSPGQGVVQCAQSRAHTRCPRKASSVTSSKSGSRPKNSESSLWWVPCCDDGSVKGQGAVVTVFLGSTSVTTLSPARVPLHATRGRGRDHG